MRLLIDNALSPVFARLLRLAGHDAVHLRERNLHAATDAVVFELAATEERSLVSADTDFAQLLAHRGATRPSLILFRSSRARRPEAQADLLLTRLAEIAERIEAGSVIVFDEARRGLAQERVGLDRVGRLLVARLRGLASVSFAGRTPDGVDREVVRDAPGESQEAVRLEAARDLPEPEQRLLEDRLDVHLGREAREDPPRVPGEPRHPPRRGLAMTPEERARLVEEATSAWRPLDRDGVVRALAAWHDLDAEGRREAFAETVRARWIEAAIDPEGLSTTARAVLGRLGGDR